MADHGGHGRFRGEDEHILVAGTGKLVETLIEHDLVDEFRFMLHPIFVGSGKRLFHEGQPKKILKLIDTKVLTAGITILFYAPAAND